MKILVIEDCLEVQVLVRSSLGGGYRVVPTNTAAEALRLVRENVFDLILMDILLPDDDGFHLCAQLKNEDRTKDIPIIFLTTKSEVKDKVMGFSLGAEDYIVKPFEPLELRARVDAKLNRILQNRMRDEVIKRGALRLNLSTQKAFLEKENQDRDLHLTSKEFKLLLYMIRHEGHVLQRERLLDAVWGNDKCVLDRTVDVHIYSLRKKIASGFPCIESVAGEGYRFSSPPS